MNDQGNTILHCLHQVAAERERRLHDVALAHRVQAVKQFQQQRFVHTYADMLASSRYGGATRFFLEDLYGPGDFAQRDQQFARIVPALVRLFPHEIVSTVLLLAQLHALSEQLDTAMGLAIAETPLTTDAYEPAWRHVGRAPEREQQIVLMLAVGAALDRYTGKPLLRHTLRAMRGPAQAAGLGALQKFLETGFDTFRAMRGAAEFLDTIARRERGLAARLFAGGGVAVETISRMP